LGERIGRGSLLAGKRGIIKRVWGNNDKGNAVRPSLKTSLKKRKGKFSRPSCYSRQRRRGGFEKGLRAGGKEKCGVQEKVLRRGVREPVEKEP